ncbi:hypothetical protein Tco_1064125, partial [Tanacetum coccineum]
MVSPATCRWGMSPGIILMSSADVARSHRGDGGGDDHPLSHV